MRGDDHAARSREMRRDTVSTGPSPFEPPIRLLGGVRGQQAPNAPLVVGPEAAPAGGPRPSARLMDVASSDEGRTRCRRRSKRRGAAVGRLASARQKAIRSVLFEACSGGRGTVYARRSQEPAMVLRPKAEPDGALVAAAPKRSRLGALQNRSPPRPALEACSRMRPIGSTRRPARRRGRDPRPCCGAKRWPRDCAPRPNGRSAIPIVVYWLPSSAVRPRITRIHRRGSIRRGVTQAVIAPAMACC